MASQSRSRWLLAGSALGVAVAAALGAGWAFRYGLDSYREPIERLVAQSTGRPFHLQGPLELTLVPLAILTGPAQLGNPVGVIGPAFAAWRSTRIALELLPLLHRRLVVDDVSLNGLEVHLQRTMDGRTNWSGLFASGARKTPARGASSLSIELRGLEVRSGEIDLTDAGTAPRVRLSDLSLNVGPVRFGAHVEIGAVRLTGQVWTPDVRAGSPIRLDLTEINLSQTPYEVAVSHAALRFAGNIAEGSIRASDTDSGWHARGALSARIASVRDLAQMLGVQVPRTRNPYAFTMLALTTDWTFKPGALDLESLHAHLDDTTISGWVAYRRAPGVPLLEFDLHGDHVNLDRYPAAQADPAGHSEPILEELRALPIAGTVAFEQVRLGGTEMHQVRLEMGSLRRAGLSGGRIEEPNP